MNHFSDHVYWLSPDSATDRPILGAVAGCSATLLVDAGNSPRHARQFLNELAVLPIAPPRFVVLTHRHGDHVFGADTLKLLTIASHPTQQKLVEMAALEWSDAALEQRVREGSESPVTLEMLNVEVPDRQQLVIHLPEIVFHDQVDIYLGDRSCQIVHVGGDHDSGSTVVFVPDEKVLFLGDCLYEGLGAGKYLQPRIYTNRFFPLIERLLGFDADFYFDAHQPQPMTRQDLLDFRYRAEVAAGATQRFRNDRQAMLAEIQASLPEWMHKEAAEMAEAFAAGL